MNRIQYITTGYDFYSSGERKERVHDKPLIYLSIQFNWVDTMMLTDIYDYFSPIDLTTNPSSALQYFQKLSQWSEESRCICLAVNHVEDEAHRK